MSGRENGRRGQIQASPEDHFRASVIDVLEKFWDRLRPCPRCGATFLKTRKQKYCSPTCANRTHWDAFKARRSRRDYRGEYARRVKKRIGSNARVKISPRRSK